MDRTQTDFLRLVGDEAPLVEIDRAGRSTMGGALSPGRLDVLLTFRAHDQRWAWHIPPLSPVGLELWRWI